MKNVLWHFPHVNCTNYRSACLTLTKLTLLSLAFIYFLMHGRQTLTSRDLYIHMCRIPSSGFYI